MTMEDEPWDEIMGPTRDQMRRMLKEDRPQPGATQVRAPTLSARAPPSNMFAKMPDRWAQHEASPEESRIASQRAVASAAQRLGHGAEEDDDDDNEVGPQPDYNRIRENARRILDEDTFSVQRTGTGDLQAGTTPMGKRQPKALAGLSFASNRKNVNRKFRDLDLVENSNTSAHRQANYEYADDDVVDVIGMEQRFAASRPAEDDRKNWSSRYSVDNTLLALSGGALANSKYLDNIDQQHDRQAARNLFGKKSTNLFGDSAFSFRKNKVFGKQGVTMPPQQNLKTVWMDLEQSPSKSPAKSWQEQLAAKRRQRRRYILVVAIFFGLVVAFSTTFHVTSQQQVAVKETTIDLLTFYATSDTPYSESEEEHLSNELEALEDYGRADFVVHLGNMQDPSETLCLEEGYENVRDILAESPYPLFVVPGVDDWRNCESPDDAIYYWKKSFRRFDQNFDIDYEVMRQYTRDENWAFVLNDVLVMGINVVTGDELVTDWTGHVKLSEDNRQWVEAQALTHKDKVRAIIVFGNARPGTPDNIPFFNQFAQRMSTMGAPVLYMHANDDNGGVAEYKPFLDHPNIWAIQSQAGDRNTPLRVRVTSSSTEPFVLA